MSDMRFWSGRPIKGEETLENGLIKVTFADESKPAFEVMSKDEFDTFCVTRDVESEPTQIEKQRQAGLQKATYKLQSDLMKRIQENNPRWIEVGKMVTRIDAASTDVRDKLFNAIFQTSDWFETLTVSEVFNRLKSPNWDKAPAEVQNFFAGILAINPKIVMIDQLQNAIMALISSFQRQVIEQEFDQPYETIRLADIVKYIEDHPVTKKEE